MALDDSLRPLFFGLRAAGHRVVAVGQRFEERPVVNLVLAEEGGGFAARAREEAGPDSCIGLVCVNEMKPELQRIAETVDFTWTCAPTAMSPPVRHAMVSFGFHPALLGPKLEREPLRRETGVVVYGEQGARPAALADRLTQAGLPVFFLRAGHFPDYIVCDLLSRAALVVVVRREAGDRAPPSMRIAKAIANGAAVLAEAGPSADVAPYVETCAYDAMSARCTVLLRENLAQRGIETLERFRRETSMADGVAAALALASADTSG